MVYIIRREREFWAAFACCHWIGITNVVLYSAMIYRDSCIPYAHITSRCRFWKTLVFITSIWTETTSQRHLNHTYFISTMLIRNQIEPLARRYMKIFDEVLGRCDVFYGAINSILIVSFYDQVINIAFTYHLCTCPSQCHWGTGLVWNVLFYLSKIKSWIYTMIHEFMYLMNINIILFAYFLY